MWYVKILLRRDTKEQLANTVCGTDDVIKYIGNTLEKHKGCDIIDLNPGAGLWSQKIHEFLQPRSHILFESSHKFDEFLRPLLDAPGSKYKLFRGDVGKHADVKQLIETEGLFPNQTRGSSKNAAGAPLNNSLLVIGSLMWEPGLPGHGFDSMLKQLLTHWGHMARTSEGIHSFGPVRSLLWSTNDDSKGTIPRSPLHRSKFNFLMDMHAKYTEVVTAGHVERSAGRTARSGREPQHEIESLVRAMQSGKKQGMELPANRRENIHQFADEIEQKTGGTGKLRSEEMHDYLVEKEINGVSTIGLNPGATIAVLHAQRDVENNPDMYTQASASMKRGTTLTEAGRKHSVKMATVKRQRAIKIEREALAGLGIEIYNLECKALGMKNGARKDAVLAKVQEKEKEFELGIDTLPYQHRSGVLSEIDDRLCLSSEVPRVQWDERPYEPLVMEPEEVWPPSRVSLIDVTPHSTLRDADPEWYPWLEDFIHGFFSTSSASVIAAMENLQPGASVLVDEAPSLRDPKKGGRLNLNQLRTRMVTLDMVNELCNAYRDWPFKDEAANYASFFKSKGSMTNKADES
jgi:transcription factor 1